MLPSFFDYMFNFIKQNKYSLLIAVIFFQLFSSVVLWLAGAPFFIGSIVYGWFEGASLQEQFDFGLYLVLFDRSIHYVPLVEEFIFRYPLAKKVNKFWWLVAISSLFWLVYYSIQIIFFDGFDQYITLIINLTEGDDFLSIILGERANYETFAILIFGLITGSILYWLTNKIKFDVHKISRNKIFNYALIAFSSIVFILSHAHFQDIKLSLIANLVFILPLAVITVYSRLKYGMITAIYMHAFTNYIASYPTFTRWDWEGGILLNVMFFFGLGVMLVIYKFFVADKKIIKNEVQTESLQ